MRGGGGKRGEGGGEAEWLTYKTAITGSAGVLAAGDDSCPMLT